MLEDLKRILGIAVEDTDLDDKLNWIISSVRSRLKLQVCTVVRSNPMR